MTPFPRSLHSPPIWWLIPAILIGAVVVFVFGSVIYSLVVTNARNRQAPFLQRDAMIVSRRQRVWGDNASTNYFVTFEFPDGQREEFMVTGEEYGLLAEGDTGVLYSQGTWFKSFQRAPRT